MSQVGIASSANRSRSPSPTSATRLLSGAGKNDSSSGPEDGKKEKKVTDNAFAAEGPQNMTSATAGNEPMQKEMRILALIKNLNKEILRLEENLKSAEGVERASVIGQLVSKLHEIVMNYSELKSSNSSYQKSFREAVDKLTTHLKEQIAYIEPVLNSELDELTSKRSSDDKSGYIDLLNPHLGLMDIQIKNYKDLSRALGMLEQNLHPSDASKLEKLNKLKEELVVEKEKIEGEVKRVVVSEHSGASSLPLSLPPPPPPSRSLMQQEPPPPPPLPLTQPLSDSVAAPSGGGKAESEEEVKLDAKWIKVGSLSADDILESMERGSPELKTLSKRIDKGVITQVINYECLLVTNSKTESNGSLKILETASNDKLRVVSVQFKHLLIEKGKPKMKESEIILLPADTIFYGNQGIKGTSHYQLPEGLERVRNIYAFKLSDGRIYCKSFKSKTPTFILI